MNDEIIEEALITLMGDLNKVVAKLETIDNTPRRRSELDSLVSLHGQISNSINKLLLIYTAGNPTLTQILKMRLFDIELSAMLVESKININ